MSSCISFMASGTHVWFGFRLKIWLTAGWCLCDKLWLLVSTLALWGQLVVGGDLLGVDNFWVEGLHSRVSTGHRSQYEFRCKNRTGLGDCENQPWQCPTHGGNSECDTMYSKIVWIRQAYLEMRSPDWIFFIWMWLAVFHYLWWLVLFSDVDDHKGCQDFTSFLLLKNP